MPPQEPPRRGVPIGRITELNQATAPHTPIPPATDVASTAPPPADKRPPPRQYQVARPVPRAPTLISSPPPPPMREKQDSVEIATGGLLELVAEKNDELLKLRAELEAKRVAVEPAQPPDLPTHWQWRILAYKLGGAVLAILVPCGAYLAYRVETLAPRVTSAEQNVSVVKTKATTSRDLQRETLEFLAAWQTYQDCVNGQVASVAARGSGHKITSIPDTGTLWGEQNRPPQRPPALWPTWTWFTIKDCGSEPHVPTLPP